MIYLVRSKYSNYYTSVNTLDYYNKLQLCDNKPWYYEHYSYLLTDNIKQIPCDSNFKKVNYSSLNTYDLQLIRLHFKAVKSYKLNNNFYWLTDFNLAEKFSNYWKKVIQNNDKII